MDSGFKRIPQLPRRYRKHKKHQGQTPRLSYIYSQSRKRFEARGDAFKEDAACLLSGEIGRVEEFRLIESAEVTEHGLDKKFTR